MARSDGDSISLLVDVVVGAAVVSSMRIIFLHRTHLVAGRDGESIAAPLEGIVFRCVSAPIRGPVIRCLSAPASSLVCDVYEVVSSEPRGPSDRITNAQVS